MGHKGQTDFEPWAEAEEIFKMDFKQPPAGKMSLRWGLPISTPYIS